MKKSNIVAEAKAEVAKSQPKKTPLAIKLVKGLFDLVAAVLLLTLAIVGLKSFLKSNVDPTVLYGVSTLFVGMLAARLIERIFQK